MEEGRLRRKVKELGNGAEEKAEEGTTGKR